jgi:hypothetical protein
MYFHVETGSEFYIDLKQAPWTSMQSSKEPNFETRAQFFKQKLT